MRLSFEVSKKIGGPFGRGTYNFVDDDDFCDVLYEPLWGLIRQCLLQLLFYCRVKSFGQVGRLYTYYGMGTPENNRS